MKPHHFLSLLTAALLGGTSLHAASIDEPFQAPENGVPESWLVTPASPKKPYSPVIVQDGAASYLQFLRNDATDQAAVYYIGNSKSPSSENQFSDFEGSVILKLVGNSQNHGGVLLRADQPGYSNKEKKPFNAYYITVRGGSGNPALAIYQDPEGYLPSQLGEPVAASAPASQPIKADREYKLVFGVRGKTIKATLYKGKDGRFNEELATVSWDGAERPTGYVGLRSNIGKPGCGIRFREFQIKE